MKTVSVALKAHLAGNVTKRAVCLRLTRTDGTVFAATLHDRDILFEDVRYLTAAGGDSSNIEDSAALAVDNLTQRGILSSASITDADIRAGLFDYARIAVFVVNWSDTSMGAYHQRDGWLGQVTTDRLTFSAELRGMMQALQTQFGRLIVPTCNAILGDARCGVDLAGSSPNYTVTGTIDSVSADGITIFDAARTEAGPTGGVAITAITLANPGRVTLYEPLDIANGLAVVISGAPAAYDGTTIIRNRNIAGDEFDLGVDTTSYPAYVSGGLVTPLSDDTGYFGYGLFTPTSGLCSGIPREVKSYVPGQWTLALPMPYALAAGDTYTMVVGCSKTFSICGSRFNNQANFRGFPFVPGQDAIIQVGRQT